MNQNQSALFHYVLITLFLFLCILLQTTLLHSIEIFCVIPNLLLITTVSYSLKRGDYSGFFVGILGGLLLDITGARLIGLNTLLFSLLAYVCIMVSGNLFSNNALVSMVFVFLLTIPYEFFTYIFHFVIWNRGAFGFALWSKILPAALYNTIFTLILYPAVSGLAKGGEGDRGR